MKVNIPVRMKNPWFWVGIVSVMLTAIGAEPSMFTSWEILREQIMAVLGNPYQLTTMALAVLAVFVDPTTAGVTDSDRALTYRKPLEK